MKRLNFKNNVTKVNEQVFNEFQNIYVDKIKLCGIIKQSYFYGAYILCKKTKPRLAWRG